MNPVLAQRSFVFKKKNGDIENLEMGARKTTSPNAVVASSVISPAAGTVTVRITQETSRYIPH